MLGHSRVTRDKNRELETLAILRRRLPATYLVWKLREIGCDQIDVSNAFVLFEERQRERPIADLDPDAVVKTFAALAPIAARVKTLPREHRLDLVRQVQAALATDENGGS